MAAPLQQVRQFLLDFKQTAEGELHVPNRDKNLAFLARHGFTARERKEIILGLRMDDYVKGPEVDDRWPDGPKCVWVFGVQYEGIHIYIKLKLIEEDKEKRAICISFHEAEFSMRFPYRR